MEAEEKVAEEVGLVQMRATGRGLWQMHTAITLFYFSGGNKIE